MKTCEECQVVAPESAEFCPRCGRPLPDQTPDDVGPRVDRLLAEVAPGTPDAEEAEQNLRAQEAL